MKPASVLLYYIGFVLLWLAIPFRSIASADSIASRVIIIGDAGRLTNGKNAVVDAVAAHVAPNDTHTTILLAGDNIYSYGLPDKEDNLYAEKANVLMVQLTPFKDYAARVLVMPGNHDWQKGGPKGWQRIENQAQLVQELDYKNTTFLPQKGCPGPEEVTISDSVTVIIMDTQWWLHEYDKPGADNDCDCKNEDEVTARLKDMAYRNRYKKILFVTHHTLRSYGEHGGYYTWKQHLFPFTELNPNAYIPLPVIGSIYPIVRGKFGNVQDLMHPLYKDMVHQLEAALSVAPNVVFAAGHDHNLQLIQNDARTYIVSGSGTNRSRVKQGKLSLFASDANGFAEVLYYNDGRQVAKFYEVDASGNKKLAYTYNIPIASLPPAETTPAAQKSGDSVIVAIAPQYDEASRMHRLLWGEHYRKLWATPVTIPVFRLQQEKGGLKVLKKGGGQQTKSLRLEDKNGKQWVLRTVQKNPERALPANLRGTVARTIVQDQVAAANPFGALTVPVLAAGAGVPHTTPQLVYVPDDAALGVYRQEFANTVCLFEEREPGAEETYSSQKVLEKLEADNDNIIDQRAVLRARMLDMFIGDWDRHEDQWRWIKTIAGKKNIYSPVPRDRDQAYYLNTGIIPYIAARNWLMPKFQGFDKKLHNVNGFMFNARYFDRMFLNSLDVKDWIAVIQELQASLSDEVIREAIAKLPDTIYKQVGNDIIVKLQTRRDDLLKYGLKYYRFLSKSVEYTASDKKELFSLHTDDNGSVALMVQKVTKSDKPGDTIYHRHIDKNITKEIQLYGRGGADVFDITGDGKLKVRTRIIGGGGEDSLHVYGRAANRRKVLVYDRDDKQNFYPARAATLHTSHNNAINDYNAHAFKYDKLAPLATAGYNLDDGILLGIGAVYIRHGFRREPFAARHKIMVGHALQTDASFVKYKGDITDVLGKADLDMYLNIHAPDNTVNFFGVGNETKFEDISEPAIRYYRTRYNLIDGQFKLKWKVGKVLNFFGGLAAQYYNMDISDNKGRFIKLYENANRDKELFERKAFLGFVGGYEIDTRNDALLPIRGFHWLTSINSMAQLDRPASFGQVQTSMSIYLSFRRYPKVVIAERIGAGVSIGNPGFFQMFYLGGDNGLLGYRKNRFAGTSIAYNNLEVRIKLFDFASYLFPGQFGLTAFNDVGRVWAKGEASGKWHVGYGGGIFIVPAETIVVNGILGISEEGVLPYISLGFRF